MNYLRLVDFLGGCIDFSCVQVDVLLDTGVFLEQREDALHGILTVFKKQKVSDARNLLRSICLFLILFAVAELLVHI